MAAIAPPFALAGTGPAPVALSDLLAHGPALLVIVEQDCPTCALALARLAAADAPVTVVYQDPPDAALRGARRAGLSGDVLCDEAPYAVSRAYGVETVPTAVLVAPDGTERGRVEGWDRDALQELLDGAAALGATTATLDPAEPRVKPGCGSRHLDSLLPPPAVDEVEELFARGFTDGLPVVAPTRARVDAMLGGRDPAATLGPVPPAMGEATLERVAACAVLAGCLPAWFPIVLAAVEAALDPAFNLHGQAVTTSPPGQVVIVNGPARRLAGIQSGMGALGSGFRANLTIGRALRLVVHLTGGAAPGAMDRATLGHMGKVGLCFAEDEEGSPWAPLHVDRGFPADASTVTLLAADSPLSISDHRSRTPEQLAACLGWAAAAGWSPTWWPLDSVGMFVLCPEHVLLFREHGWSKERVRQALFDAPELPARLLTRFGEAPPAVHAMDPDAPVRKWSDPERVQVVCAGGPAGRFSALLGPSLGMTTTMITREIRWTG